MAGVTGFTIFAGKLLAMMGIRCLALSAVCRLRRQRPGSAPGRTCSLSALLMLICEGASVALISVLCFIVLGQHHLAVDTRAIRRRHAAVVQRRPWRRGGDLQPGGLRMRDRLWRRSREPTEVHSQGSQLSLIISGAFLRLRHLRRW